jgi:predicted LPLAT superfamily acyltransferase
VHDHDEHDSGHLHTRGHVYMQGDLKNLVAAGEKARVAVLGASGYTGAEVIRLCANHPHMSITSLTAERAAGKEFSDVFPSLAPAAAGTMVKIADVDFDAVDAAFCCLPHATTQTVRFVIPVVLSGRQDQS